MSFRTSIYKTTCSLDNKLAWTISALDLIFNKKHKMLDICKWLRQCVFNMKCVILLDLASVLLFSNLTNASLFTNDVELVNLSNLEVLILRGNHLDGSLTFKGNHSIIYFNCKINFHVTGSSFSISQWAILKDRKSVV